MSYTFFLPVSDRVYTNTAPFDHYIAWLYVKKQNGVEELPYTPINTYVTHSAKHFLYISTLKRAWLNTHERLMKSDFDMWCDYYTQEDLDLKQSTSAFTDLVINALAPDETHWEMQGEDAVYPEKSQELFDFLFPVIESFLTYQKAQKNTMQENKKTAFLYIRVEDLKVSLYADFIEKVGEDGEELVLFLGQLYSFSRVGKGWIKLYKEEEEEEV